MTATGAGANPFTTGDPGPAVELDISVDLVKRGLIVAPVLIAVCGVIWSADGAWSSAYAIGLVLVNFLLAAATITATARISLGLMMGATLFGYLIRLALIFLAVWAVRDASWISFPALGASIIVTHLGLLAWELKYVALTLTQPGIRPHDISPATRPLDASTQHRS